MGGVISVTLLSKKVVGIDISDKTIEVAEVALVRNKLKVLNLGRETLGENIVKKGRIIDKAGLTTSLKKAMSQAKPKPISNKNAVFGLPESQVYTLIFEIPASEKSSLDDAIKKEISSSIPLNVEDVVYAHTVLYESDEEVKILLVALAADVLNEWKSFFQEIGIDNIIYDTETLANLRSLFIENPTSPTAVVDIGAFTSTITITDNNGLQYVYSINFGGDVLADKISKSLNISISEAETLKYESGLMDEKSKVFPVIDKSLQPLQKALNASVEYFEEKFNEKVKGLILVGGTSKLKGLVEYLKNRLQIPVWMGESTILKNKASLEFVEAIGLALKGLTETDEGSDLDFVTNVSEIKPEENKPVNEGEPLSLEDDVETSGTSKRKQILFIVLIVSFVLSVSAIVYTKFYQKESGTGLSYQPSKFEHQQELSLAIVVSTDPEEYVAETVRGRIIEDKEHRNINEAEIERSRVATEKLLKRGEKLWSDPLNLEEGETLKWLVYSEADTTRLYLKQISAITSDFILGAIEENSLVATSESSILNMLCDVTLYSSEKIENTESIEVDLEDLTKEDEKEKEESTEEVQKVTILDTPLGVLNVREGPSLEDSIITQVSTGDDFVLLDESGDWYKIDIENNVTGWIYSLYATKGGE